MVMNAETRNGRSRGSSPLINSKAAQVTSVPEDLTPETSDDDSRKKKSDKTTLEVSKEI